MRAFIGSLAATLALAAPAAAQKAKLHLERADVRQYPLLKLYLSYVDGDGRVVTGKTKDEFKLTFDSSEQGAAADAKAMDQIGEPVYVAVVAQVSAAMHDVFDDEKKGVKQLAQAALAMKGSKLALIAYAQDVKRLVELGTPSDIEKAADAMQEDTEGTEVHLLDAVRTAIDVLSARAVPEDGRKLIVVFSDGIDVAGPERKGFAELGRRAHAANIVIDTVGYAPFEPGKLRNLAELAKQTDGNDRACKSTQEVGMQFGNVADELRKQYIVLFRSVISGDGHEHTIQVTTDAGGTSLYSNNLNRICENHQLESDPIWKRWWFWTFCVALPLGALLVLVLALRGRSAAVPAPEPMEAPMPSAPSGPQRTVAIDVGNPAKGPTIGWIVGMSGQYVDRTFKLLPQRTVIGTSDEADIRIEDAKVSRKHCEIRYDGGQGFRIVDLGSTNGVVLNDKRVPQSELVDGDFFRLGATEFKFKSIN
jgi:hypothetical protein